MEIDNDLIEVINAPTEVSPESMEVDTIPAEANHSPAEVTPASVEVTHFTRRGYFGAN